MAPNPFAPGLLQRRRKLAYRTFPFIHGISPVSGRIAGGTSVTITGLNFRLGATVLFDDSAATNVVVVDSETITCDTPAEDAAIVDVKVTVGSEIAIGKKLFTFFDAVIIKVTPAFGNIVGGTAVVIEGYGFISGSTITFDGVAATGVLFVDSQHLHCTTPARTGVGFVDVVVTSP
ncbi:hypothetical protein LCGC14_1570680 [marine sediment metagenome]|uniref:IPT/TIG domain-containing protein n=1 Tax=marine sediment metagenome TaxID=412755 RepID=A0A0F9IJQ2_9ZZZZ